MDNETAITPAPKDAALEKVEQNIAQLAPREDKLLTITSKSLGEVLPAKFYEGASQLALNETERALLTKLQDTPDEDVEIRPDGLVYAEHIHARRALTELFGAEWALLPGSAIAQEKSGDKVDIFQRWVLAVRGRYVGEAIGCGTFWANNSKSNKSDAAEGAQSEALRRICAKSALGIGSNVWDRRFAREWRREYAVQVWVKTNQGNKMIWRRKDDDPIEGEIGPVETKKPPEAGNVEVDRKRTRPAPQGSAVDKPEGGEVPLRPPDREPNRVPSGPGRGDEPVPAEASPEPERPPKVTPQPITSEPATPAAAAQEGKVEMVNGANFRWLMMEARRRKLVVDDDAKAAIELICTATGKEPPEPFKDQKPYDVEILRGLFLKLTIDEFNRLVVPAVRSYGPKG